jgi:tetratricopeptide (TPR) repeat protein
MIGARGPSRATVVIAMRKVVIFTLFTAANLTLRAADDVQLALSLRAQSDFDRVALAAAPPLRDATACIQSEAAIIPVATPEELPIVHFRKGYCTLASAGITRDPAAWRDAADEFDRVREAWPARAAVLARRRQPAEPVSSGVRVLAQIARLEANDAELAIAAVELGDAINAHACPVGVMAPQLCEEIVGIGRQWQGWMALRANDLDAATRDFAATPGWSPWVAGRMAFRRARYAEAAADDQRALADWNAARRVDPLPVLARIAPSIDLSDAYAELGGAQFLAGNSIGAISSLTQAVKERSSNARAIYLRARAQEAAGHADAAESDYNLASRTALANATDLASGEAHLYRGILLYRRRQYPAAEDEFSSALSFEIVGPLRADAGAWRRLAAVVSGSCGASRAALEQALPAVSPYFPKDEARSAMAACGASR